MMNGCVKALWRGLLLVAGIGLTQMSWAGRSNYQEMYVFGDSLSDTGNAFVATTTQQMVPALPPSTPPYATYWQGRFTNGPVAAEYLWDLMNRKNGSELAPSLTLSARVSKAGVSFAFGGSTSAVSSLSPLGFTVPGLVGQVQLFDSLLAGKRAPANALYLVWSGSNDYLQGMTSTPSDVVGNVAASIRRLYAMGARSFLVPNLPDMGTTPFVQLKGGGASFTQLSQSHNALLSAALTSLSQELRAARIVSLDVFALGAALAASGQASTALPALEYLAPGTGAADCLFRNPATCVNINFSAFIAPFLFWDVMHPTTQIHGLIGSAMFNALQTQK
jgi:outer membrane lipase/esterase